MNKPRIIRKILRNDNDKLIEVEIKDTVKKLGRSGYISLPKELIGKYVNLRIKIE